MEPGASYTVVFASGTSQGSATVEATAVVRADLADGEYKPQLVVALPAMPLGPTSITVMPTGGTTALLVLDDAGFTVVPEPLPLPDAEGEYAWSRFTAAVSRAGVVYFSIDLAGITAPYTFRSWAEGYPLQFTVDDVLFYNRQGFLMQRLDENMPGLGTVRENKNANNSDRLLYSRHEFATYFLQHEERQLHEVATDDPSWHLDGTLHIDHEHLIVAIAGRFADGSLPVPGATPPHTFVTRIRSLFHYALAGDGAVEMSGTTSTEAYCSVTGLPGDNARVLSNVEVTLRDYVVVNGSVIGPAINVAPTALVNGELRVRRKSTALLPVDVPSNASDLGALVVAGAETVSLTGPASYRASEITVQDGGTLYIENAAGAVTVYVTGTLSVAPGGMVALQDETPETFAVYVAGSGPITLEPNGGYTGVVYAPAAPLAISGQGNFSGAFVGSDVTVTGGARIYYDIALRNRKKCTDATTTDRTATSTPTYATTAATTDATATSTPTDATTSDSTTTRKGKGGGGGGGKKK
jgi:hypothetical protein